jgi:hypothetical protein
MKNSQTTKDYKLWNNLRAIWLESIEMLKDINLTVQDDIRDFFLTNYEHFNHIQNEYNFTNIEPK